ncbi:efflux RND transporter periplasmic adaptor subunit [Arcticibacter eurypsychrophilus]|uniref:efflux RND transporter periplasmic adaptor subunit n=1 Tax=Arcticibacter eurypsychrophilus TaxID=1434752 RepID=UPI00084D9065|nr:efflux RND transporter periplasmic adaptor subunit [Arcticibacter eurypsychrophilus]
MNTALKKYKTWFSCGNLLITVAVLSACGGIPAAPQDEAAVESQTPVTVTAISTGALSDSIVLNAISVFQQKSYIKANAIGYITQVKVKPGQFVSKGQLLFIIKTKESQSIGNSINILDTTFKFSGVNHIRASNSGYITQLNHQLGDYVQDGEQLAAISDKGSFAFLLQLPYEYISLLGTNKSIQLTLPDGRQFNGRVSATMPTVDSLSQTQGVVIQVNSLQPLPENLVAKARLIKSAKSNATTLPKLAVLADEAQTTFWVMKLINDTMAVKTLVKKGIEMGDKVEILSPAFTQSDRILVTGNYGLADTAKVKIVKP